MATTNVDGLDEVWKDVPGFEGYYKVSSYGRVRSLSRVVVNKHGISHKLSERILKPTYKDGYVYFGLYKQGKMHPFSGHNLVMISFVGPRPKGLEINHINAFRSDNSVGNLEYVTHAQNTAWHYHMPEHLRVPYKLQRRAKAKVKTRGVYKSRLFNQEQVVRIKELRAKGMMFATIARVFGVSSVNIYRVFEEGRYNF